MSTEENKAVIRRFNQVLHRDIGGLAPMLAPDFKYLSFAPDPLDGRAYMQGIGAFNAAFPDGQLAEEDLVAAGDKVVTRWTFRGTHQGEYQGIPPRVGRWL